MREAGVSEGEACEHIQDLIVATWMKVNKYRVENPQLSNIYMGIPMNMARMALCWYQHGDGHAIQDNTKDRVASLLFQPIPLAPL